VGRVEPKIWEKNIVVMLLNQNHAIRLEITSFFVDFVDMDYHNLSYMFGTSLRAVLSLQFEV